MALVLSFLFQSLLVCGLISDSAFAADNQSIIIEEHPSPILIPVNATAVFSCKASCSPSGCISHWLIETDQQDTQVEQPTDVTKNGTKGIYTSSLSIDTSVTTIVNGSNISCTYELMGNNDCSNHSSSVKLLLVLDPPISPNPRIDVVNETHLNITWSPPFLWPGHRIQSYNVSLSSALHDGAENTISDSVNSTYTSETVSLIIEIQQHQINILCSNYTLKISPTVTGTPMQRQPLTDFNDTFGPENLTSHDQCNHGQSTFTSPSTDVSVSKGDDGGVLLYKVSMFVSLSLAAIFFGILVLIISCACLSHRKKQKEEKARDAKKNIYNTMIPNPIYDGSGMDFKPVPVYECIKPPQPAFYSRPGPDYRHAPMTLAAVTAMNDNIVQSHSDQQGTTAVKSISTGCHANIPATVTSAPKKSAKERNKLHLTLSLPGTNSVNPLMSRSHRSDVTESTYPCSPTRGNNQAVKSLDQHGKIVYGNSEHYDV